MSVLRSCVLHLHDAANYKQLYTPVCSRTLSHIDPHNIIPARAHVQDHGQVLNMAEPTADPLQGHSSRSV